MKPGASIHDNDALAHLRRKHALEPEALQDLKNRLFKRHQPLQKAVAALPPAAANACRSQFREHVLALLEHRVSAADQAEKILFGAADGRQLESVLMRSRSGRPSVCVSSQVGCPVGCPFCATGGMGFTRNLSMTEILDQVVWANHLSGDSRGVRNVMFMGMGEPMLNPQALHGALERLISPSHFALSPSRIMVSTAGLPTGMLELAKRFPGVSQALSLHSARQSVRETLVPLAKRYPLSMLRKTLETVASQLTHGRLMIEYLLLKEVNDSAADARELGMFLQGMPAYVNIIRYNTNDYAPGFEPSSTQSHTVFATIVETYGFMVTQRYSLGADIGAACGQLAGGANSADPRR